MPPAPIVLSDVPVGHEFWTHRGTILHNLQELKTYLATCSEDDFLYHVNQDHHKNDFAVWIRDVIHDDLLAHKLSDHLSRSRYLRKIAHRLKYLLEQERAHQVHALEQPSPAHKISL